MISCPGTCRGYFFAKNQKTIYNQTMTEIAKPVIIPKERKPGTLHSFFALKFHEGDEDRAKVEAIEKALNKAGITITLMARDVEKWGKAQIPEGKTLMTDYAFPSK